MYIPSISPYKEHLTDAQVEYVARLAEERSKERLKKVRESLAGIIDDEFERLKEYSQDVITETACQRATEFIEQVTKGNELAAMELLGERNWNGRAERKHDRVKRWVSVIHGRLSVPSIQELRKRMADAIADKVRDGRIADLEDQVEALLEENRELARRLEEVRSF